MDACFMVNARELHNWGEAVKISVNGLSDCCTKVKKLNAKGKMPMPNDPRATSHPDKGGRGRQYSIC
jgi:hypothetical protein